MAALNKISTSFQRHIDSLYGCIARLENQFVAGKVSTTDVELLYSAAFLSAYTRWESFLEDSLIEIACGKKSNLSGNFRLAEFRSRSTLRNLLLHPEKDYLSLSSIKQVTSLAKILVNEGRPFSLIGETNKTYIQQASWIRNAIAHQSSHSLEMFRHKVSGVESLPRNRRLPATFLRQIFRSSPSQRRFEVYFTAFKSAASEVSRAW